MNAPCRAHDQPAYVLRTRAYRETSLLLELFTAAHGRIGLIARGARRPKARVRALLQPFQPLRASWQLRGDLGTLAAVEAVGAPFALRGDALFCGWYLNELLLRSLMRGDPHLTLFADYGNALVGLAAGRLEVSLRVFEKRLLDALGYGLSLPEDLRPRACYRYDWQRGPIVAAAGEPGFAGDSLRALAQERLESPEQLRDAKRLLRGALRRVLGDAELASVRAIRQMRQLTPSQRIQPQTDDE